MAEISQRGTVVAALTAALLVAGQRPAVGQTADLTAIVDGFYPQELTDLALAGGATMPVRNQCYAVPETDSGGNPRVVVAGYTNLTSASVRVLVSAGGVFSLAAEASADDLTGWSCEAAKVDVDRDGRYEAHVKFLANNGSMDWIYAWNGQQLSNLTPTTPGPLNGAPESRLVNAEFVDADGDGTLEVVSYSQPFGDEPPDPSEIYRFSNGQFVFDRAIVGVFEHSRTTGGPQTEVETVQLPSGAQGPLRLRIVNGTSTGGGNLQNAVTSGRVWWNGREVVHPSDFNNHSAVIDRSVTAKSENELKVRLAGSPGHISIVIDPASWTP